MAVWQRLLAWCRKNWQRCLVLCLVLTLGIVGSCIPVPVAEMTSTETTTDTPVFILDAGHGGEDGGAVAEDGTLEKELNLAVTQRMEAVAKLLGYRVVLTRTDDTMLYDRYEDKTDYGGKKKTYDLKNRLRFAKECGGAVFCSIHMNQFPDPACHGLQVYYSPNVPQSRSYATLLQGYAKAFLDPENHREIKKATSAIYLLHRIQQPAVLVECGFLSSPIDRERLSSENYQLTLSAVLMAALAEGWENNAS